MTKKKPPHQRWRGVRGRVWFTGPTVHFEVIADGKRVFYDNTGAKYWRRVFAQCLARVDTVRHLYVTDRTVEPYMDWNGYCDRGPCCLERNHEGKCKL